ncbi:hypothetical protein VTN77DRAFT_9228 [Rasamsonia byssochlamydoides]|uniref:uncharacterized protein n=1 Tax=Rasamsonia byssochlamydoides TaxID=89139 RepID=UPI0037421651
MPPIQGGNITEDARTAAAVMAHLQGDRTGLVVAYIVLNLVSVTAVGVRFYAISISRRRVTAHDILCVIALVALIGYSIDTLIGAVYGGIGLRLHQVTESQLELARKVSCNSTCPRGLEDRLAHVLQTFFVSQFFWAISVTSYRLAVLHLQMQMFPTVIFCRVTWICVLVVVFFFVASAATTASICWPVQFAWDKNIHGVCSD